MVRKKGMYVELKNLIKGLVPSDSLLPVEFDATRLTYVSPDCMYKLGSNVNVVLANASKEARTVEFHIASEEEVERYKQYTKTLNLSEFGTKE